MTRPRVGSLRSRRIRAIVSSTRLPDASLRIAESQSHVWLTAAEATTGFLLCLRRPRPCAQQQRQLALLRIRNYPPLIYRAMDHRALDCRPSPRVLLTHYHHVGGDQKPAEKPSQTHHLPNGRQPPARSPGSQSRFDRRRHPERASEHITFAGAVVAPINARPARSIVSASRSAHDHSELSLPSHAGDLRVSTRPPEQFGLGPQNSANQATGE